MKMSGRKQRLERLVCGYHKKSLRSALGATRGETEVDDSTTSYTLHTKSISRANFLEYGQERIAEFLNVLRLNHRIDS